MGCSVDDDGSCDVQPTTTIAACKDQMTIHEMANAEGAFGPWHLLHDAAAHMENMAPANMADMGGGLVSTTAAGQQTGESLLEYYKVFNASLEKELSSSFTCIDDGKWKVTKPIMIVADGHASRYDANVLQYCEDEELYQCIEPGQTSAFLQMLDQIFKNLHQAYNRGCKELARWHSTTYHEAVAKYNVAVKEFPGEMHEKPSLKTVNRYDATQVFGKDHGEAGPTWVNRASVQAAWRVVGVTSSGFDVSAIPAGRLVDDMAVTAAGIPGAAEHGAYVSPDRPRREHLIAMDIPSPYITKHAVNGIIVKACVCSLRNVVSGGEEDGGTGLGVVVGGLLLCPVPEWYLLSWEAKESSAASSSSSAASCNIIIISKRRSGRPFFELSF